MTSHSHLLQQTSIGALPTPQAQGIRRSASITRTTVHTMTFVSRSSSMPREKEASDEEEPTTPTQEQPERSMSERPSTPLALQQVPQAPQFIIPLPPQLLVACDARLVLATEVACNPPANFSWFKNGEHIPAQAAGPETTGYIFHLNFMKIKKHFNRKLIFSHFNKFIKLFL